MRAVTRVICPRCGISGYLIIEARGFNKREYIYVMHKSGGEARKCYIGSAGLYEHVSRVHMVAISKHTT